MVPAAAETTRAVHGHFLSRAWVSALLLTVATALAYAGTFAVPFVFDDVPSILANDTIHHFWRSWRPPSEYGVTVAGRPLVNVSLAIDYALSGTEVWSYHVTNLIIHLLAGLLLFGCVRRTLSRPPLASRFGPSAVELSLCVAGLWLLHPLQTEAVTYTIQRAESLMGFFFLLTLWCFIRSTESGVGLRWKVFTFAACLAGMATKEVMVSAPLLIAFYDRVFVSGTWMQVWRQRGRFLVALACTWILLAVLVLSTGGRGGTAGLGTIITPMSYALTQAYSIGHYLRLVVWPFPLVFDYGTSVVTDLSDVVLPGLLLIGLLAATVAAAWKGSHLAYCGVLFFCVLAPSSSIVPVATQTIAEHRMYLPLAAVFTAGVVAAYAAGGRRTLLVFAALAMACGFGTAQRNRDYRDALSLWGDTAAKRPSNVRALNNYALELQKVGRSDEANRTFARAVEIDPTYVSAHSNWGAALLAQHRIPEAIEHLQTAVRLAPTYADARLNLGNALVAAGRSTQAIFQFEAALEAEPNAADARFNLGLALDLAGQRQAAEIQFKQALEARPDLVEARYRLARIAEDTGRLAEAEQDYREVLHRDPSHAAAEAGLGVLLARSEQMPSAEEHLKTSLRLRPNDADTLSNLGNVYLLQGKVREAITQYEASLRIRPDDTGTRENLAVAREALAATGK